MDISSVRLPLVNEALPEEPSTRGLSLTGAENVVVKILNLGTRSGVEGIAEPRGGRREARKNVDLRELTNEEMVRAYNDLEREMRELRNNLGKRVESSNTETIRAWRTGTREAKEKKSEDIEEKALLLSVKADRIRKRTEYARSA